MMNTLRIEMIRQTVAPFLYMNKGDTVYHRHTNLLGRVESGFVRDARLFIVVMFENRERKAVWHCDLQRTGVAFEFTASDEEHLACIGVDPDRGVPPYLGGVV